MVNNDNERLEKELVEILKEMNLKQAELDNLRQDIQKLETEVNAYKGMYEDYKEAADDRWERLKYYEENKFARLLCSLHVRLKKKEIDSDNLENEENIVWNKEIRQRYYALYSREEKDEFEECKRELERVVYYPLISLVIPVYNTTLKLLDELYFSLKEQIYNNWEVCFANGSKDNQELNKKLEKYAQKDKRVKVKILDKNGGISYNTNQAFGMASGEFIGMVDHDDLLSPNALAEVVLALNKEKDLDFIYSDQDKVDEKTTKRFGTLYKPSWSMELLYSGNYITHFSVIRSSIIRKIGFWNSDTDGAQDWDLFLKVAEKTNKIYAIPKVLYHWRTAPTSTALSMDTKNYASEAQIRCLQSHFDRMGYNAEICFSRPKDLEIHVKWQTDLRDQISVVIYDEEKNQNLDYYLRFIELALGKCLKEIIFVSSNEKRLNGIRQKCKKILVNENSYACGFNAGAKLAQGNVIVFETDTAFAISSDLYQELSGWAMHPQIGLVGPKILNSDREINAIGIALNKDEPVALFQGQKNEAGRMTPFGTTSWYRNVTAMPYYCFAIEKKKYCEVHGFEQKYKELAILDFCIRVGKKYRNMINPFAVVQNNNNFVKNVKKESALEYNNLIEIYNMPDVDVYYNPELLDVK